MQDIQTRVNSLSTRTKLILAGIAAFLVAPIIFTVVKGLIGLAAAGIVGGAIIAFAPVVSMKFANWRVRAITGEAKENPIETLTNLLAAKRAAFNQFKSDVTTAITARSDFENKVADFAKKYPARAPEFRKQLERMTELVERKKVALADAEQMLADGANKLEEMRAYWAMSEAAIAANRAAGMDTGDLFEKLKADTACDAVFSNMNRAFAELEVAASLSLESNTVDAAPTLGYSQPVTLIQPLKIKERAK